jgi:hypothetical protein
MSIFEYVMVLVSVVLSLGIAHILARLAELLKAGPGVKWSVTWLGWIVVIVLLHIDLWGSLWFLHDAATWSIGGLALALLGAASLYMAAALATPDVQHGDRIDLWDYFMTNRRRFATGIAVYGVAGMTMNAVLLPAQFGIANLLYLAPFMLITGALAWFKNSIVQRVLLGVILVMMAFYFVQFFPKIG